MPDSVEDDVYSFTQVVISTMRECASLLVTLRTMLDVIGVQGTSHLIDDATNLVDGARDLERLLEQKDTE